MCPVDGRSCEVIEPLRERRVDELGAGEAAEVTFIHPGDVIGDVVEVAS
jgi:hypothetical protein